MVFGPLERQQSFLHEREPNPYERLAQGEREAPSSAPKREALSIGLSARPRALRLSARSAAKVAPLSAVSSPRAQGGAPLIAFSSSSAPPSALSSPQPQGGAPLSALRCPEPLG